MRRLLPFLSDYKNLEKPVVHVIVAEFFIQLVNATFMNILPLYMTRKGFSDEEIALFITFRFLGVFALALPLGRYIKGKKLLSLFVLSNLFIPVFGLCIVISIEMGWRWLTIISLLCWGSSFTFMQVPVSPYILRNSAKIHHTAALSLSYSTWSFAGILSGLLIAILDAIDPAIFDEKAILLIFSVLGAGGLFFLRSIRGIEERTQEQNEQASLFTPNHKTDWGLVLKALVPTLIIATGAGLTIPFISLFFEHVHGVDKGGFSVLSSIAAVLVAYCAMLVPRIKHTIGYKIAIPGTQSMAVVALVALATTQFYNQYSIALIIASACYLLRQPLMNMAGPMTSELVLNYVGSRHREITSALTSAIWSGSWVISGIMVKMLFARHIAFVNIFLITALLYAIGVILYYLLILDYAKREEKGLIEP